MTAFDVLTLHPEMVRGCLHTSVLGRAVDRGHLHIGVHDLREHTTDRHRTADDTPYGGGAGMVMKIDVVAAGVRALRREGTHVVLTGPGGRRFEQADARRLGAKEHVLFLCGHYEGIDARVYELVDEELSIGDFVLTGGEIAAAAMIDASARLLPGVLGNQDSPLDESFADGLLEYPHFTRPRSWEGHEVPEVLLSGHHGRISAWRKARAMARTRADRPDLWKRWCAEHAVDPQAPIPGIDDKPISR